MDSDQTGTASGGVSKKSAEDRDDLILELIKRRYDFVLQNINALDTKAASLIGFVSIVVGLMVGGETFRVSTIVTSNAFYVPYFISVGFLLASISFGFKAFHVRNYLIAPDVKVLLQRYTQPISSYSDVLQTTAGAMLDAIDLTEGSNRQKAGDINISWILLLLGLVLAFILLGLITLVQPNGIVEYNNTNNTSEG